MWWVEPNVAGREWPVAALSIGEPVDPPPSRSAASLETKRVPASPASQSTRPV